MLTMLFQLLYILLSLSWYTSSIVRCLLHSAVICIEIHWIVIFLNLFVWAWLKAFYSLAPYPCFWLYYRSALGT